MAKRVFRRWEVSQGDLFPPTFQELVPAGHLVHFVRRLVVEDLDLSAIYAKYAETKGQPPYDPRLMTALLRPRSRPPPVTAAIHVPSLRTQASSTRSVARAM